MHTVRRLRIAVIGTGISGLSAAWLLNRAHDVVVYERADRVGGHSNTVEIEDEGHVVPVDTGFIVFNQHAYPNLSALFRHLGVRTQPTDMSLSISLDGGSLEYSGGGLRGLFAQPRNIVRRRFWSMLSGLVRFYRRAPRDLARGLDDELSLGAYLDRLRCGAAFRDDHLLPMASAIWSAAPSEILSYPAAAFIRFHENHGLLRLRRRPAWETVVGGCRRYVDALTRSFADRIRLNCGVRSIARRDGIVLVTDISGRTQGYDHAVIATHADQALALLADATAEEATVLGDFRYSRNLAILHCDDSFMPRRRSVWSSWNCLIERRSMDQACVTYWINRLQKIGSTRPLFVTLNPPRPPRRGTLLHTERYDHPIFDAAAMAAQQRLWRLQGQCNTWFCGAHFGSGFHEDGLQAGLAVAERLGGVRRPWQVENESARVARALGPVGETAQEQVA